MYIQTPGHLDLNNILICFRSQKFASLWLGDRWRRKQTQTKALKLCESKLNLSVVIAEKRIVRNMFITHWLIGNIQQQNHMYYLI